MRSDTVLGSRCVRVWLTAAFLAPALIVCTKEEPCRPNTVLVQVPCVDLPEGTSKVNVVTTTQGGSTEPTPVAVPDACPGSRQVLTVQVNVPAARFNAKPPEELIVEVTSQGGGQALTGRTTVSLTGSCQVTTWGGGQPEAPSNGPFVDAGSVSDGRRSSPGGVSGNGGGPPDGFNDAGTARGGSGVPVDAAGVPGEMQCSPNVEVRCSTEVDGKPIVGLTAEKDGKGPCRLGVRVCNSGVLGPCLGAVGPSSESCNAKDDDCNGTVDDIVPTACEVGTGACRRTGQLTCPNGVAALCSAVAGKPQDYHTEPFTDGAYSSWDWDCDGSVSYWGLEGSTVTITDKDLQHLTTEQAKPFCSAYKSNDKSVCPQITLFSKPPTNTSSDCGVWTCFVSCATQTPGDINAPCELPKIIDRYQYSCGPLYCK